MSTALLIVALVLSVLSFIVSLCSFFVVYSSLKKLNEASKSVTSNFDDLNLGGLLDHMLGGVPYDKTSP